MKKLKDKLRKLSLTQLVSIVVLMLVSLIFFWFVVLKVDAFVDKQMYGLIHRAQQNVIYNYIRNLNDAIYMVHDPILFILLAQKMEKYIKWNELN